MDELTPEDIKAAVRENMHLKWKQEFQERERRQLNTRRKWIPWAAAVALLVSLGTVWFLAAPKSEASALFADYFEPIPNVISPETRGNSTENALADALRLYDAGAYRAAISKLETISPENYPEGVYLYLGIAHLALGETEPAKEALIQAREGGFQPTSMWYLALTYLKTGDLELSESLMEDIVADADHPYRTQAAALLDDLR